MKKLCLIMMLCLVAGCSSKIEVLKSPCAGEEGSPCGPKRPVNEWWQGKEQA